MNVDKKFSPLILVSSVLGGVLLPVLFLLRQGPPEEIMTVIIAYKQISNFHFWYGLFFLFVLFWIGFLSVWMIHSFFLWIIEQTGSFFKR